MLLSIPEVATRSIDFSVKNFNIPYYNEIKLSETANKRLMNGKY